MLVKCPSCHTEYDCEPGKYQCRCGAEFTVPPDSDASASTGTESPDSPAVRIDDLDVTIAPRWGQAGQESEKVSTVSSNGLDVTIAPRRMQSGRESTDVTMPGSRERKTDGRFEVGDLVLGRYKVLAELGQGGMGVVYRCFDETAGIEIALKALPPELSHNSLEMEDIRENFRLVHNLHHPNIASYNTLEKDNSNGNYYLVMECVSGKDLRTWIRRKRRENSLNLETTLPIIRQVASALDYAHEEKIIHRDIKPGNIMIDQVEHVKVLDFGLAAQIHTSMTRVSMVSQGASGTAPYMAPEQWRGWKQDAAADQYALAVMTYEMIAGYLPFDTPDVAVLREAVLNETPKPIESLPKYAQAALEQAMSKDPVNRFKTCSDFVEALSKPKAPAPAVSPAPAPASPSPNSNGQFAGQNDNYVLQRPNGAGNANWSDIPPVGPMAGNGPSAPPPSAPARQNHPISQTLPHVPSVRKPEREVRRRGKGKAVFFLFVIVAAAVFLLHYTGIYSFKDLIDFDRETRNRAQTDDSGYDDTDPEEIRAGKDGAGQETDVPNRTSDPDDDDTPDTDRESIREEVISLPGGVNLSMVKVEAGSFEMSAKDGENEPNEVPHRVTLKHDFYIGRTEVTQEQWKAVMGNNNNPSYSKGDDLPVERVSWNDAMDFCEKLNGTGLAPEGWMFTLPTETQWEYAARGGRRSKGYKYSGSNDFDKVAWCYENSDFKLHPVGQKKTNELGLYDMSGNLYEWCLDDWQEDSSRQEAEFTRDNRQGGSNRVIRSSSWAYSDSGCRSSSRSYDSPDKRIYQTGFRLVLVSVAEQKPDKETVPEKTDPVNPPPQPPADSPDSEMNPPPQPPGESSGGSGGSAWNPTSVQPGGASGDTTTKAEEEPLEVFTIAFPNDVKLELVKVEKGTFTMSANDGENGTSEVPHQVTLTRDFYIGRTEVTQAQWKAVMGSSHSSYYGSANDNGEMPVRKISWRTAMSFCEKLNSMGKAPEGWQFSLPTETQWEYAARGGNRSKGYKYSGSNTASDVAWYHDKVHTVAQKKPNELGLYDMSGNLWEFCLDDYSNDSSKLTPEFTRTGKRTISTKDRTPVRGGSWHHGATECRSASRAYIGLMYSESDWIGFRVALVPEHY